MLREKSGWFVGTLLALAAFAGCGKDAVKETVEVVVARRGSLPTSPADPMWSETSMHAPGLILQDMVEPRLLVPTTSRLEVRAMTDGRRIAFRLEWPDATGDDLPGAARFTDACAVQLPSRAEADVPAPQMGEEGRPVEITYWRASWQAVVDGRGDEIEELYPGASVDHYPFEAPSLNDGSDEALAMAARYAPARRLGNAMAGPRASPVEDLIAEGPGTLASAPDRRSTGRGMHTQAGWQVVIERPMPADLGPGGRSQVAFAVWDGAREEVGSRKMRTGWVPLRIEAREDRR